MNKILQYYYRYKTNKEMYYYIIINGEFQNVRYFKLKKLENKYW